ncbi:hypothetical protein KJ586_00955 [Patescibacteria group bacterium]|nr:hypothetical protein [Patescibacteria group bacterium]
METLFKIVFCLAILVFCLIIIGIFLVILKILLMFYPGINIMGLIITAY